MKPLAARVAGIVRAPRATVAELSASTRPPWVDVLLTSTLVSFAASAALLLTPTGQLALVDQWERTALAFGRTVDDGFYARLQGMSSHGVAYALLTAVLQGPVLAGVATLIALFVLRMTGRGRVAFIPVLSVVSHAGVILALRAVVVAPISYLSETLTSPTTLIQVVAGLDETSPLARFLGVIDLFVVWWVIVLAIGLAVVANRRARPLALTLTGVYVAIALLLALAMAATGGTA